MKSLETTKHEDEREERSEWDIAMDYCTFIKRPPEGKMTSKEGQIMSSREDWIREAKRFAEITENPHARKLIEETIAEFEK